MKLRMNSNAASLSSSAVFAPLAVRAYRRQV
jgi:hypothetical protein